MSLALPQGAVLFLTTFHLSKVPQKPQTPPLQNNFFKGLFQKSTTFSNDFWEKSQLFQGTFRKTRNFFQRLFRKVTTFSRDFWQNDRIARCVIIFRQKGNGPFEGSTYVQNKRRELKRKMPQLMTQNRL